MKLHRDLGISQKAAWFMLHRIREAMAGNGRRSFSGPVEVDEHTSSDAPLYTDTASAYGGTDRKHETVKHSAKEYVRDLAGETVHTNGVESFWSVLKRAYKGTFHRLSVKHLQRYLGRVRGPTQRARAGYPRSDGPPRCRDDRGGGSCTGIWLPTPGCQRRRGERATWPLTYRLQKALTGFGSRLPTSPEPTIVNI